MNAGPLDYTAARSIAEEKIAAMFRGEPFEIIVVDDAVVDTDDAWYFPYNGRDYLERGLLRDALAGNIPIRVAKDDGSTSLTMPPNW